MLNIDSLLKIPFNYEKHQCHSKCSQGFLDPQILNELLSTFDSKRAQNQKKVDSLKLNMDLKPIVIVGMEKKKTIPLPYCPVKIQSVFKKLQTLKENGVYFEEKDINRKEKVIDGLCSAIALASLRYIVSDNTSSSLANRLIEVTKEFQSGAPQELAILQAVFNTIHLTEDAKGDLSYAKMQSLANAFDLKLSNPFKAIEWEGNLVFGEQLKANLEVLKDGAYCIRMLWKTDNHKQEAVGHSVVLVKEESNFFILDSGRGLFPLGSEDPTISLINILGSWGISSDVRIYPVHLQSMASLPSTKR